MSQNLNNHAIIAGFGVPGRAAADWLAEHHTPFCVIELNPTTVTRCGKYGVPIIAGDVNDETILRQAGIDSASMLILAVPNDKAVLSAIAIARRLNPDINVVARCNFISIGLQATRLGAREVIVAEQVVANELLRVLDNYFDTSAGDD
jgi:monovalent cation:H+ antiporter-2, CPA2 family